MAMVLDTDFESEIPYWVSVRRRFSPDSPFFASGNIECELLAKKVALDFSEDEKYQLEDMLTGMTSANTFGAVNFALMMSQLKGDCSAIADSGTSLLAGPTTLITMINHAIGASGVVSQQCKAVVEHYGQTIMDPLLSEARPKKICSQMGLCTFDAKHGVRRESCSSVHKWIYCFGCSSSLWSSLDIGRRLYGLLPPTQSLILVIRESALLRQHKWTFRPPLST